MVQLNYDDCDARDDEGLQMKDQRNQDEQHEDVASGERVEHVHVDGDGGDLIVAVADVQLIAVA